MKRRTKRQEVTIAFDHITFAHPCSTPLWKRTRHVLLVSTCVEAAPGGSRPLTPSTLLPSRQRPLPGGRARTGPRFGFGALQQPAGHHGSLLPVDGDGELPAAWGRPAGHSADLWSAPLVSPHTGLETFPYRAFPQNLIPIYLLIMNILLVIFSGLLHTVIGLNK